MNRLLEYYRNIRLFIENVLKEESIYNVPLLKRIKMNRHGFTADQYIRYEFDKNDINEYISEYERWKTRRLNGHYNYVLDDKLISYDFFQKEINMPQNYAWIKDKIIYDLKGAVISEDRLIKLLKKVGKVVIKPVYGSGSGGGVHIIEYSDNLVVINQKNKTETELRSLIKTLNNYILVEYAEQHRYSSSIFDKTTNTIRIISVVDKKSGEVKILRAVHRIGVKESIPVDNGKKGALVSLIDLESGVLGVAKTLYSSNIYSHHPESKQEIVGVKIPFWAQIKNDITNVAKRYPYIPFMAWDILVTPDSYTVIEINGSSGLNLFQMWQGERNTDLGSFFKQHKIFK